jgi:hypothetical protein
MRFYFFKKITFFILLFSVTSCVSVKNSTTEFTTERISNDNFEKILANYSNLPIQHSDFTRQSSSLWNTINYNSKKQYENWKDLNVRFFLLNNELNVELLENENVLEVIKLKGRFKNGYFLLKNQYKFDTLFLYIINGIGQNSTKFSVSEKELVVLHKKQGVGLIVIFPCFASGGGLRVSKFKKVE